MFWGGDKDPVRSYKADRSGLSLLLPNARLCCDSLSVRATAYALLTYTARKELIKEPIVQWLNARRHSAGRWSSGFDSVLATRALVGYALDNPAAGGEPVSLSVNVQFSGNKKLERTLSLGSGDAGAHTITVKNFYGHVKVETSGVGRGLVQLANKYRHFRNGGELLSEKQESPVNAFDLIPRVEVTANRTKILLTTCQR